MGRSLVAWPQRTASGESKGMGCGLVSAATGRSGRSLAVDLDLTYGSAKLGRRIAPDLYATGGVRRLALNYEISLGRRADACHASPVSGTPSSGSAGIGWGRSWSGTPRSTGGGFGVGADVDLGASFSLDWKPVRHFGLTGGYNFLHLKVSDSVANRDVTLKLTAHGPTVGFGVYF